MKITIALLCSSLVTATDQANEKAAGCYTNANDIAPLDSTACKCHSSCSACGYSSAPTGPNNCLSCSNTAFALTKETGQDYGTCAARELGKLG